MREALLGRAPAPEFPEHGLRRVAKRQPKHLRRAIVTALVTVMLQSGCGKAKEKEAGAVEGEAATPVQVDTVKTGPIDLMVEADAVLYPLNQSNVTSKIAAPVRRILVNRGDHVKAGQLIAELESRDLASAAQESKGLYDQAQSAYATTTGATVVEDRTKAEADVQTAQQALDAAKKVYESRADLQKQGALAQKLVDEAKVAMVQAQSQFDTARQHLLGIQRVTGSEQVRNVEAQVAAAKAHYESANVQLSYAEIRAPFSGIIADRPLYPGELAQPGSAVASIVDISQVIARANIPLKQAAAIRVCRSANISAPDGVLPGKVTVVSPSVNPSTTTVEVWIQAGNPGERLKPGGTVHVSIRADLIKDTLLVPAEALLNSDEGGEKVMVFGKDSRAHERKVTVGIREGSRVQILGGVTEGEQVITSGGLGLEDKAKVMVKEEKEEEEDEDKDAADDDGGKGKK
jgi:HlyD family secretion protein